MDDVTGEVIGHALERFMDAGARDASATPVIMKKGRPGFLVRVISLPGMSTRLAELMARESERSGYAASPRSTASSRIGLRKRWRSPSAGSEEGTVKLR